MSITDPNGPLEDIAFQLLKLREENFIIKAGIQKLLEISTKNAIPHIPVPVPVKEPLPAPPPVERIEVYINSTEVQRILNVSEPVVRRWVSDGLLSIRHARSALNNKYFLSEIEWLKKQHYRKINAEEMRALVKRKKLEFRGFNAFLV